MSYSGPVWVITGASSGIGYRTALDLAADGAVVCGVARREERLVELLETMGGAARGHSYFVADVSRPEEVAALGAHVRDRYGRCDVLVNNAGFSIPGPFTDEASLEILERVMATNFFGAVMVTKELLPLLLDSAPSAVVNVASVAGRLALQGAASYCASKFALVGWSESLNFELASKRVHVAVVEPGPITTEGFPQSDLLSDRLLRRAVSSPAAVSKAIRGSAKHRKLQRVVPRPYYLLQVLRYVVPALYTFAQKRLVGDRVRRNMQ